MTFPDTNEKSLFQKFLYSEKFGTFESGFLGPELDAVLELRQGKKFFGDLFKPERKVLYGADFQLLMRDNCAQIDLDKMSMALFQDLDSYANAGVKNSYFSILLCDRPDLSLLFHLAAEGVDACLCSPEIFDNSGLQYFTEWCRELRISPIWFVNTDEDLKKVVDSDAPYAAFYLNEEEQDENDFTRMLRLRRALPNEFIVTCVYRSKTEAHLVRLARAGFDCYLEI